MSRTVKRAGRGPHASPIPRLHGLVLSLGALLFASAGPPAGAEATPEQVAVIANQASDTSLAIAEHYCAARKIPTDNLCRLDCPEKEEISRDDYEKTIRDPLQEILVAKGLRDRVQYLVTTKGVPLKIAGPHSAAVDSELCLLFQEYELARSLPNPYHAANQRFDRARYDIYLVCRLTGYTAEDAKGLVDRALAAGEGRRSPADGGVVVLDVAPHRDKAKGYGVGNDALRIAANVLGHLGARVKLDHADAFLTNETDVICYSGWGSNDGRHENHGEPFHTWLPGALATTFVSTNGRTFTPPPEYGQSLAADLVKEGVTGAVAHVYEPFLSGVGFPDLIFPAYMRGYDLAESCYMGLRSLSWMATVVGDPLCRPFSDNFQPPLEVAERELQPDAGRKVQVRPFFDVNYVLSAARAGGAVWFGTTNGLRWYEEETGQWRMLGRNGVDRGAYGRLVADEVRLYAARARHGRPPTELLTLNWATRQWREFALPEHVGTQVHALGAAKGELYLSTKLGAARADLAQEEWEIIVVPTDAQPPIVAFSVFEDDVWAVTSAALLRLRPGESQFRIAWDAKDAKGLLDVSAAADAVWAVGNAGAVRFDRTASAARRYGAPVKLKLLDGQRSVPVRSGLGQRGLQLRDEAGNAVDFGLLEINGKAAGELLFGQPDLVKKGNYTLHSPTTVLPSDQCRQVRQAGGTVSILTAEGLVRRDPGGEWEVVAGSQGAAGFTLADPVVWLWSRLGVRRIGPGDTVEAMTSAVPGDVNALATHGGRVWIGSRSFGLFELGGPQATPMRRIGVRELPSPAVRVLGVHAEHLWIGTGLGLARMSVATGEFTVPGLAGAPIEAVVALAFEGDTIWLGTVSGLWEATVEDGIRRRFTVGDSGLTMPQVTAIVPHGSDLWVRTTRAIQIGHLAHPAHVWHRWDRERDEWHVAHPLLERAFSGRIYHVAPTEEGLWLVTDSGPRFWRPGEGRMEAFTLAGVDITPRSAIPQEPWFVVDMGPWEYSEAYVRPDGLWMGTRWGAFRVSPQTGRFLALNSRQGLADDRAWCMAWTDDQTLWVGAPGGLSAVKLGSEP